MLVCLTRLNIDCKTFEFESICSSCDAERASDTLALIVNGTHCDETKCDISGNDVSRASVNQPRPCYRDSIVGFVSKP